MSDPKKTDEKVTIPPKAATAAPATVAPTTAPAKPATTAEAKKIEASRTMSSVGAELHPDAPTTKVDGKLAIDAGGTHPAAAPLPTPAEAVLYPATGGLPDTGPNSKYVLGTYTGPELYNRDGQRVNADGQLIDDFGNVVVADGSSVTFADTSRRVTDRNLQKQDEFISEQTKAEMEAGRRALANR